MLLEDLGVRGKSRSTARGESAPEGIHSQR